MVKMMSSTSRTRITMKMRMTGITPQMTMKPTAHQMQQQQQQQSLNSSRVHLQASLRQRLVCLQSRLRVSAGLTMLTQQNCRRLQTSCQSLRLQESQSLQEQEYLQICQVSLQEREICQVSWMAVAAAWGSAGSCRTAACLLVLLMCWKQRRS
jgi:hypothetical protein